jgi:prolyl oligopeptidase PreP (S9A serine peptidase family)
VLPPQGHAWCSDYGNPDTLEGFQWVYPYSPLHNVRQPTGGSRQYPAMLITTGANWICSKHDILKALHQSGLQYC